ncbi:MAG: SDR family NAD(P)-dependent oxidoreductase [Erythrobacter sp.]
MNDSQQVSLPAFADSSLARILITGASGHLGSELASQLAGPGVSLALWGRDPARLETVAERCRARGAAASVLSLDVDDLAAALAELAAQDTAAPFDLVLLVAGQGKTQASSAMLEDAEQVAQQCHVNFTAPAAMAASIAARMCARSGGRIGVIGSAAGFHSLPFAPSYAGSKAGLARFTDALRLAAKPYGVSITLAIPGFIAGPQGTAPSSARPYEIPVEKVAASIIAAVMDGRANLIIPKRFMALRWFDAMLPRPFRDRLLSALPRP